MASPFSWPVFVHSALRAPSPVNLGVRLHDARAQRLATNEPGTLPQGRHPVLATVRSGKPNERPRSLRILLGEIYGTGQTGDLARGLFDTGPISLDLQAML